MWVDDTLLFSCGIAGGRLFRGCIDFGTKLTRSIILLILIKLPCDCSEQRIKRAFDVSAKRKVIHPDNQPKDTYDMYLEDSVDQAKLDREERSILNSY